MAPSNHSKLGRVLIAGGWHDNKKTVLGSQFSVLSTRYSVLSTRYSVSECSSRNILALAVFLALGSDLPPAAGESRELFLRGREGY